MPSFAQMLARLSDIFAAPGRGIPFANRNGFIDGAFDSLNGSVSNAIQSGGGYTQCVMWMAQTGPGGAGTCGPNMMRNGPGVMSQSDSNPGNCFFFTMSTASTGTLAGRNLPAFWQRLEFVNKYAGKSVTLSMKMWVSGSPNMAIPAVLFSQSFGTGGSPSPNVDCTKAVNWTVTPTIQKFSVRVDLPAIGGTTFGTNGNDFLQVGLWLAANWTGTLYIMEPQVELCSPNASSDLNGNGGAPTAFEYRGLQAELARVQRYYRACNVSAAYVAAGASQNYGSWVAYGTPLRALPAITATSVNNTGSAAANSFQTNNSATDGVQVTVQSNAGGWITQMATFVSDARL